jgi:hypothetical protein
MSRGLAVERQSSNSLYHGIEPQEEEEMKSNNDGLNMADLRCFRCYHSP